MRLLGFQGTHSSTCSAWMSFLHIQTFSCVCTSVTILFSCWVKWWTLDLYYNFSSQAQVTATCLSWLVCLSLMGYLPCDPWFKFSSINCQYLADKAVCFDSLGADTVRDHQGSMLRSKGTVRAKKKFRPRPAFDSLWRPPKAITKEGWAIFELVLT